MCKLVSARFKMGIDIHWATRMVRIMKWMKKAIGWAACLGLAGGLAWAGDPSAAAEEATAVAVAAAPSIAAAREPEIRHLDRETDAADLKKIWRIRKKLPEPFVRRNNFG